MINIENYLKSSNIFIFILFMWILSIPFKNFIYQTSTIFLIVFFIFYVVKTKDYKSLIIIFTKYRDLIYIFMFIIFIMTISNILNSVEKDSWEVVFKFIVRYAFIFFILIYFYSKKIFTKELMFIFIIISLTIQLFMGLYQSVFVFDISNPEVSNRIRGFTFHSNNYSLFMGIGFLIVLSLIKNIQMSFKNLIYIFLVLLFGYILLFTYSRAAWLGVLVTLLFYFIYHLKNLNIKTVLVLLLLVSIVFMIISNIDVINYRFKSILSGESSGRVHVIWFPAIDLIKEKFIIGYGLGLDVIKIHNETIYGLGGFHNISIEILFHIGFLGLFSFLILLFYVIKEIYKQKKLVYMLVLIFIIIDSQFDQSIFLSKPYLSILTIFMFFVFSERVRMLSRTK